MLSLSQTIKGLHWDKVPGDNDDEVAARGILYLLIFQQLGQLVRWSWGYNVLLAPPEKFEGTIENANTCLENGKARTQEIAPLLRGTSIDSERDEQNASGSDDTKIDKYVASKSSASGSQSGQSCHSGQETPVTPQQQTLSSFSRSLDDRPFESAGPLEALSTPLNGNVRLPEQDYRTMAFARLRSNRHSSTEEMSKETEGLSARIRKATVRYLHIISRSVSGFFDVVFKSLPKSLQTALINVSQATKRFLWGVWAFMNPPLWAMLAAIVVASIPDLQRFFFSDGTFFKNSVTSAIRQSGGVAVPLILVVLGANLARNTLPVDPNHTTEDEKEETKLLIAALLSRMLFPIVIMAPLLTITAKYVPVSILDDPIFVIVCFLITGAPSALQLAQICQINNVYMGAMSRLLFQSYVVWILPSTLVLVMCALEVVEWAQH